ncbi:unnamed protein product [Brassica rapa subsp. narinosa]
MGDEEESLALNPRRRRREKSFPLVFLLISYGSVEAWKRRIEISDDLDDVEDNEEDESWKQWGSKAATPEFDPPPDFSDMCSDMVVEIAMRWTKVLITCGLGLRFMAVDRSTVMFNMQNGKEVTELRELVLSQEEAYEVNIWKQEFRRPGDPPLDNVFEKLQAKQSKDDEDGNGKSENDVTKDELC